LKFSKIKSEESTGAHVHQILLGIYKLIPRGGS
jgi:hypothetical protein